MKKSSQMRSSYDSMLGDWVIFMRLEKNSKNKYCFLILKCYYYLCYNVFIKRVIACYLHLYAC